MLHREGEIPEVIFIGPQGCGKGTQANILAGVYPEFFRGCGSGEVCRAIKAGDVKIIEHVLRYCPGVSRENLIRHISEVMRDGGLVADRYISAMAQMMLDNLPPELHGVWDGVIRNIAQLDNRWSQFGLHKRIKATVIRFVLSDAVSMDRMRKRNRFDDTPEAIAERLTTYEAQTNQITSRFEGLWRNDNAQIEMPMILDAAASVYELAFRIQDILGLPRRHVPDHLVPEPLRCSDVAA